MKPREKQDVQAKDHASVTHDGRSWSNTGADTIEVVDADPSWPDQFAVESQALKEALRAFNPRIEHFGSTAVPNLAAKPILDIFVIIEEVSVWPHLIAPMANLGYIHWAENPRTDRMFFVKGMPPFGIRRSHHVHVRTSADAIEELHFRDWLRGHPDDVIRYQKLKRELAERFKSDREAYTAAKSEFIRQILTRIEADGQSSA